MALRRASANTRRTPDYCANRACNAISYRAWQNMPKSSPALIASELEVSVHGVTAKGNLSKAKKWRKISVGSHPNSFASWIVLASFYPNSKFNQWTGGVFARQKPGTHGSAAFWEWMAGAVHRMVAARRSSAGFYKACARAVNVGFGMATGRFRPRNMPADRTIPASMDVNKSSTMLSKGLAQVFPAANGTGLSRFTVSATESDTKGKRGDLERVAGRVWQQSVNDETQSIMDNIAQSHREALREVGFKVR